MSTGKVKFFNSEKGFGFITENGSNKEFFVHISEIENKKELQKDDEVTFDISEGKKGPNATNVKTVA